MHPKFSVGAGRLLTLQKKKSFSSWCRHKSNQCLEFRIQKAGQIMATIKWRGWLRTLSDTATQFEKKSRLNWKNYQPKSYFFSESDKNKFYEDMQTLSSFRNARNLALSESKFSNAASLLAKNLIKSGIEKKPCFLQTVTNTTELAEIGN